MRMRTHNNVLQRSEKRRREKSVVFFGRGGRRLFRQLNTSVNLLTAKCSNNQQY